MWMNEDLNGMEQFEWECVPIHIHVDKWGLIYGESSLNR
jgi:hypothetical protein